MESEKNCCHRTKERSPQEYKKLVNRLSRIEGQIRGIKNMVEEDAYCIDILVLVAAAIFEPGLWSIILILGFVDWPGIARLVRGNVLSLRETNFVKSSIVAGMPVRHILFSDILPNTVAPILVYATSVMALSMLDEASLSFLGMGVQPPAASLGNMLNSAQSMTVLTKQPWLWLPPGLLIVILVVAINFVGDALRDALDPSAVMTIRKAGTAVPGDEKEDGKGSHAEKGEGAV